jgi:hypothetical protein
VLHLADPPSEARRDNAAEFLGAADKQEITMLSLR